MFIYFLISLLRHMQQLKQPKHYSAVDKQPFVGSKEIDKQPLYYTVFGVCLNCFINVAVSVLIDVKWKYKLRF